MRSIAQATRELETMNQEMKALQEFLEPTPKLTKTSLYLDSQDRAAINQFADKHQMAFSVALRAILKRGMQGVI